MNENRQTNSDISVHDQLSNRSSSPVSPFERSLSEEEVKLNQNNNFNSSTTNSFMILDILEKSQSSQNLLQMPDNNFNGTIKSIIEALNVSKQKYPDRDMNEISSVFEKIPEPNISFNGKRSMNYSPSSEHRIKKEEQHNGDIKRSLSSTTIRSDNFIGSAKKLRKARTAFTDAQLAELESSFEQQKYLSVQDRMELAERLNLSDMQVKTWYQNRRTKWKRQTAVGLELLNEVGNLDAVQRMLQTNPYWAYHPATQSLITELEQTKRNTNSSSTNVSSSNCSSPNRTIDSEQVTLNTDKNGPINIENLPKPLQELIMNKKDLTQKFMNDPKGSSLLMDMLNNFMKFSNINTNGTEKTFPPKCNQEKVPFWP